jgi:hypothetical protein
LTLKAEGQRLACWGTTVSLWGQGDGSSLREDGRTCGSTTMCQHHVITKSHDTGKLALDGDSDSVTDDCWALFGSGWAMFGDSSSTRQLCRVGHEIQHEHILIRSSRSTADRFRYMDSTDFVHVQTACILMNDPDTAQISIAHALVAGRRAAWLGVDFTVERITNAENMQSRVAELFWITLKAKSPAKISKAVAQSPRADRSEPPANPWWMQRLRRPRCSIIIIVIIILNIPPSLKPQGFKLLQGSNFRKHVGRTAHLFGILDPEAESPENTGGRGHM